jgi:hypothetical protein
MNTQQATDIFMQIQQEYHRIRNPKYRNIDLDIWLNKYQELLNLKSLLQDNPLFQRLVNGLSQILSKCEKLKRCRTEADNWINTSERGINKALPVLVKKAGTEIEFPYEWIDEKYGHRRSITNGYWGARNYMLMDALGYFYLLKEGGDRLPDGASEIFRDIDSIRKREIEFEKTDQENESNATQSMLTDIDAETIMKSKHWVRFNDKIFRKFTSLQLASNDILKLLMETSRVEFKLAFPVRLKLNEKEIRERVYLMNMFSRLFEFGYIERPRESDGVIRKREYFVTFNTILGELFVHNLKMKNYDWIREDLYSLPSSAQIFFRKFIVNNNLPSIPINLENIVQKLNLVDRNKPNLENTISTNVLEPLKMQGFISSYQKSQGLHGTKIIVYRDFNNHDQGNDER